MNFRVAKVRKPIAACSAICKAGNDVSMWSDGGEIVSQKHGAKTPLYIKNGVYYFDVWLLPRTSSSSKKAGKTSHLLPHFGAFTRTSSSLELSPRAFTKTLPVLKELGRVGGICTRPVLFEIRRNFGYT